MDGSAIALKINLDEESLEILENLAGAQRCTLDEFVTSLVRKAIRGEQKNRRPKPLQAPNKDAPLDAFLPEGADPFGSTDAQGLGGSFEDVQARMRFAGMPSIFKETDLG